MAELDFSPLSPSCYRSLTDKLYDKRKVAAAEIEKMVRDFVTMNSTALLDQMMGTFKAMCDSPNANTVKGGLMGIGAMAVAMGQPAVSPYAASMIDTILACFVKSHESRLRYYGCEALFNVCKSVRSATMPSFNRVWCAMAQLKTDPDLNVRSGADMLDRLMNDLVVECPSFDLPSLMPHLRDRVYTDERIVRQLIITWLGHLHSLPDHDLLPFLPELLDGLFRILSDPDDALMTSCESLLQRFLDAIHKRQATVDFASMISVLIIHMQSSDANTQRVAVSWTKDFVALAGASLLPHLAGVLLAVLPCLALGDDSRQLTKENAKTISHSLMQLIRTDTQVVNAPFSTAPAEAAGLSLQAVVEVLTSRLADTQSVPTKVAILKWFRHLEEHLPDAMYEHLDKIFPVLLTKLSDPADEVVVLNIQVLAEICSANPAAPQEIVGSHYFNTVMDSLLQVFENNLALLEDRGPIIIRQLCILLSAEQIFRTLAVSLRTNGNLDFVSLMIRQLNSILMTSAELYELRTELRELRTEESRSLFLELYRTWCDNPIATISLCLLTQNYHHSLAVVKCLGSIEVTVDYLTELDRLVQLLETPIFTYLRLQLLEPWTYPELVDTLYGMLMTLPQTEAFNMLRRRLDCVPSHRQQRSGGDRSSRPPRPRLALSDEQMLAEFRRATDKRRAYREHSHSSNLLDKLS
ncbi:protein VAC14 homolog [Pollicipes pollicipes]|uniref:protein VAC14 homolog n=1 Tax=Pollicipes pollicipes TaxID=41117 RepID=UPI00188514A3|nr:protein VAC14 homolog [Pollicipes pollicipes]XP_037085979.1 protein VAC14 homolog [Pollicipes pollicipes]XP_037085980.1 protein VAC14 homolog [Pollicipes pollicipes]